MFFRPLETERLYLHNISAADRAFMLKQFSCDEVNRYLFDAEPFTCLEDADELIEIFTQDEPREQHRWIITLKDTGEKIGTCGFHCWNNSRGYAELGYDLQPAYWGKGYMTEALEIILPFARDEMKLRSLDAHIALGNEASMKAAKRQGFVDTGERYMETFRGKDYEHAIYRKSWNA